MSTRDRFFSSLSAAQDQLQGRLDALQQQYLPQQQGAGAPPSAQLSHLGLQQDRTGAGPSQSELERRGTLPYYTSQQGPHAVDVPPSVLAAPPGQAQHTLDSMPRSRLENSTTSDRDRRRAAEEMRRNQEMLHRGYPSQNLTQEQRAMGLKKVHSYATNNGKVVVDIHTLPQRSPTFMGGSAERGRGAMQGQVILFAQDQERVSAVRLKIKAVARTNLPRSHLPPSQDPNKRSAGPAPSGPVVLSGRSPRSEPTTSKEHLLLQLEKTLWAPDTANTFPARDSGGADGTYWKAGRHTFDFKVDLPAIGSDGKELPPSFVYLADSSAAASSVRQQPAQLSGAISTAKRLAESAGLGGSAGDGEWASIKWYVKVTIERPGWLKTNERVFAPFVFLPPPSKKMQQVVLPSRNRLSQQIKQDPLTPSGRLYIPISEWGVAPLDLNATDVGSQGKKGVRGRNGGSRSESKGLWSRVMNGPLLSGPVSAGGSGQYQWTIRLPNQPSIWPLKSSVPFELRVENSAGGLKPPIVGLFLRVTLMNSNKGLLSRQSGPQSGTETRLIGLSRLYGGENTYVGSGIVQSWRGVLDLPGQATPDFESPLIDTEYFIAVQKEPGSRIVWAQKVLLVCSMPVVKKAPNRPAAGATNRRSAAAGPGPRQSSGKLRNNGKREGSASAVAAPAAPPPSAPVLPPRPSASQAALQPSGAQPKSKSHRASEKATAARSPPPSRRGSPAPGPSRRTEAAAAAAVPAQAPPAALRPATSGFPPPPADSTAIRDARRPSAGSSRRSSAGSILGPSAPSSAVGAMSTAYPPEKSPAVRTSPSHTNGNAGASGVNAGPSTSSSEAVGTRRSRRREHQTSAESSTDLPPGASAPRRSRRNSPQHDTSTPSSRAPSVSDEGRQGRSAVGTNTSDEYEGEGEGEGDDEEQWEFGEGEEGGAEDEGLEAMGMDLPPDYWEAMAEMRDPED